MEDAYEIGDKSSEAILDNATEDKQETRDEMLSRHRYLFFTLFMCLTSANFPLSGETLGFWLVNEIKISS